jgi:chromosome transmission fidelity protein 18
VLDQELQRTMALRDAEARRARFTSGAGNDAASSAAGAPPPPTPFDNKENLRKMLLEEAKLAPAVKKDFFGRVIEVRPLAEVDGNSAERRRRGSGPNGDDAESGAAAAAAAAGEAKVWVTFHEGLNNAVRKPLSLQDFLRGM